MSAPCQKNQSCPEIEKAKLEMYQSFSKMMTADFRLLLDKLGGVCEQIAVQSEQLRAGTQKFIDMEVSNRELDARIDKLVRWQAGHTAQQEENKESVSKSGRRWGIVAIIVSMVVQFFTALWTGKGSGG